MYRSFNLSYARGELSRHGDVRGGCGISVSDLSSASRAILTMVRLRVRVRIRVRVRVS